jgi:proliferating cell nuclear antigen
MFKARIAAQSLKDSIEALNALVPEARFVFKPEGLSVKAVDPANVAMVSLDLSSKAFESYEAEGTELGIDLKKMNEVLGMASKDEVIGLELDEVEHRLLITMRGLAYTMALIDLSAIRKEPKMPALVLPGHVTIRGEDFRRAVKAVGKISGYISVGIAGYSFFMVGEGDTDNVRFELTREQVVDLPF